MRIDGIDLVNQSHINNDVIQSGTALPTPIGPGHQFYVLGAGLFCYDGTQWDFVGGGNSNRVTVTVDWGNTETSDAYVTVTGITWASTSLTYCCVVDPLQQSGLSTHDV